MSQHNKRYNIEGNNLFIDKIAIEFDFNIAESVEISNMLIVRLDKPIGLVDNENVFGVSLIERKIKWQIPKRSYHSEIKDCPFISIRIFNNELELINWCSIYLVVNPLTGGLIREGWTK
jgi:hypothetical protein